MSGVAFEDRAAVLNATRNAKMARSTHAYVRGSTIKFYEWLERSDRVALPEGPPVWICGDCHVGNLGPLASANGRLEIQIRDVDQTVIGNPAHDLVRLGLSLAMAARGSDLPGVTTARMVECMIEGYESGFADQGRVDVAMPPRVEEAMRLAAGRSWRHLADERIEGISAVIPLGKRFWPLLKEERAAIELLCAGDGLRHLATTLRGRDGDAPIKVLDAAYWRKGCSSLGRLRFAVLVQVGKGKHVRHCLMDIKEAVTASAPRYADAKMPRDNAERVVEGARHLSPHLGERMLAARLLDKGVFVRELMPQDLKLDVDHLEQDEAQDVARYLATIVGLAHARQMGTLDGQQWLADLQNNRSKSLDAPSWLWSSIVDLIGLHESAYLEHCRRYAFAA